MKSIKKYKIKLLLTLLFKYLIPVFITPILLIILGFKNNNSYSFFIAGIIILISGIISYIYNNILDILSIFFGLIFIIYDRFLINFDHKINNKIIVSIFILLVIITLIDFIRFVIFNIYKGKKIIKKKEDIEILHFVFHPKKIKNQ